jgi:hypothetical protein
MVFVQSRESVHLKSPLPEANCVHTREHPLTVSHKYGNMVSMKTTLEIPDTIFRRAKSKAAEQGIPLRQFVTEAVAVRLKNAPAAGQKPWMKHMGKLKDLRKETARIVKVIEEAFEEVDPEIWPSEIRATETQD